MNLPKRAIRRDKLDVGLFATQLDPLRSNASSIPLACPASSYMPRPASAIMGIVPGGFGGDRCSCLAWVDETGGESYYIGFPGPAVSFVPNLDDVVYRLNRRWWLAFLAKSQPKAGMQPVKLMTEVRNAEVVGADSCLRPSLALRGNLHLYEVDVFFMNSLFLPASIQAGD